MAPADTGPGEGVERPSDFGNSVARWVAELTAAERVTEKWRADAKRISRRYTLESRRTVDLEDSVSLRGGDFNILHSNIQTMLPAVFGQEPVPVAMRRHRDPDPVGRMAAQIIERALKTELEEDSLYEVMRRVTQDLLLVGRGVPWVRFAPTFAKIDEADSLVSVRTPVDYVLWSDFLHAPKTTWAEVMADGWVARRVSMTRDQGLRRFGPVFRNVPLGETGPGMEDDNSFEDRRETIGRASVWEIWDASSRSVVWICREYEDRVLDRRRDPLRLDGFFPCPRPAFGTLANANLVPTPDYLQYEKLADELDDHTVRISVLVDAVRVTGVYDGQLEGVGQMLEDDTADRNKLIPITNWSALSGRTMDDVVKFLPLDAIASALVALYDARERTKQVLYEVSGLSDIMRGQVNQYEKLGQSRLKGQFASQRIQQKIHAIEDCARGAIRIKAEIMAEHYDPQFLRALSGYDFIPEIAQLRAQGEAGMARAEEIFVRAVELLKSEKMRGFRIDVETNSTMAPDDAAEKEGRVEFLRSAGEFLERALPVAAQVPQLAPLMADMMLFSVRGFRAGRQLESAFEEAVEGLKAQAAAPPAPEQEDPAAQAEAQRDELKAQADLQKAQLDMAAVRARAEADMEKIQAEIAKVRMESDAKILEVQAEMAKLQEQTEARRQAALIEVAKTEAQAAAGAGAGTASPASIQ